MYTSGLFMPSPRSLPAVTPTLLCALLATAAVLVSADQVPSGTSDDQWAWTWVGVAVGFALAAARPRFRGAHGALPIVLRLAAVVVAAALLARRGDAALVHALIIFPSSASVVGRLDLSEVLFGALLILPALASSTRGVLRGPRPGLLVPVLVVLGWVGWIVVVAGPGVDAPDLSSAQFGWVASASVLAWTPVLLGPAALALPPGLARRASPWVAAVVGVGVVLVLAEALRPAATTSDGMPYFAIAGQALRLPYSAGLHVGSGAEGAVCFVAAQAILVLGARAAARNLAVVRPAAPVLLAVLAWMLALWWTEAALLVAAGTLGWATAIVGIGDEVAGRTGT